MTALAVMRVRSLFLLLAQRELERLYLKRFSDGDRTDMILLTHYFCDFNRFILIKSYFVERGVFCRNLTFIWLTLKALYMFYVHYDNAG
jgi:hypothetical protein